MAVNLSTDLKPYRSNLDYLTDQLKLLDTRINLFLLRNNRKLDTDIKNFYRGLVLSDKEFGEIMAAKNLSSDYAKEINKLENDLFLLEVFIQRRVVLTQEEGQEIAINKVFNKFKLSNFEQQCILIALAVELDRKYEKIFSYLQNDVEEKNPTVGLVLELLCSKKEEQIENRIFFERDSSLMKYFFAPVDEKNSPSLLSQPLRLNGDMVNFLLGRNISAEVIPAQLNPLLSNQDLVEKITAILTKQQDIILFLTGKHGTGKKLIIKHIAHKRKKNICLVDFRELNFSGEEYIKEILKCLRQAVVREEMICLDYFEAVYQEEDFPVKLRKIFEILEEYTDTVFILSEEYLKGQVFTGKRVFNFTLPVPDGTTRKKMWDYYLEESVGEFVKEVDLNSIANKFFSLPSRLPTQSRTWKTFSLPRVMKKY